MAALADYCCFSSTGQPVSTFVKVLLISAKSPFFSTDRGRHGTVAKHPNQLCNYLKITFVRTRKLDGREIRIQRPQSSCEPQVESLQFPTYFKLAA